jgi:hypothetical protein
MLSTRFVVAAGAILSVALAPGQIRPEVPSGEVIVESAPGATVTLNGAAAGKVASTGRLLIPGIPPGVHLLEVQHSDKRPYSRKVTVRSGGPTFIRATLAYLTGALELLTTPEAEVLVDGKPSGVAHAVGRVLVQDLRVGRHSVRAGRAGYNSREGDIRISPDVVST